MRSHRWVVRGEFSMLFIRRLTRRYPIYVRQHTQAKGIQLTVDGYVDRITMVSGLCLFYLPRVVVYWALFERHAHFP